MADGGALGTIAGEHGKRVKQAHLIYVAFRDEPDPVEKIAQVLALLGWRGCATPTMDEARAFAKGLWHEVFVEAVGEARDDE